MARPSRNLSSGEEPLDEVAVGENELAGEVEAAVVEVTLEIGVGEDDMSKVLLGMGRRFVSALQVYRATKQAPSHFGAGSR
jgi:hypothetical protein